jgi:DNA modification methylase
MRLCVNYRAPSALFAYNNNPRVHNAKKLAKLRKSIERFGILAPVLIDASGTVIDGHARLTIAIQLSLAEVPVISTEGLAEADVRAVRLAMNRLQDEATWDPQRLRLEFEWLMKLDFDLDLTGFDATEIDMSLDIGPEPAGMVEEISEEELAAERPLVTQKGDVWVLGPHRVGCGNCLDASFRATVIGDLNIAVCFADAPYNVRVQGHVSSLAKHEEFAMASGEMSLAEFLAFCTSFCGVIAEVVAPGAIAFLCMDWRGIAVLVQATEAVGLELLNIAVWVKTNPGMGSLYRSQHELIAVVKRPGWRHRNNVELGKNGRSRSNVWTYRGVNVMGPERHLLFEHPTVKPAALVGDALKDVSRAGDIVFDPFLGSGSTLIAAERTQRRCIGIEIAPKYVDLTIRRWQAETSKQAVREHDGASFDEVAAILASGDASEEA